MKYKWDNKNVLDYAVKQAKLEGELKGELEGKLEGKLEVAREIAFELKKEGLANEIIARVTKLSIEEIDKL